MDGTTIDARMTDLLYELYTNWRRLKGYPSPAVAPIERRVDKAAGIDDDKIMAEFAEWFTNDALARLPR